MNKKMEFILGKEREARVAITFFQKQLAQKEEELKTVQAQYDELKRRPMLPVYLPAPVPKLPFPNSGANDYSDGDSSLTSSEDMPDIKADLDTMSSRKKGLNGGPLGKVKKGKKLAKGVSNVNNNKMLNKLGETPTD